MSRRAWWTLAIALVCLVGNFADTSAQITPEGWFATIELQATVVNEAIGWVIGLSGGYQNSDGVILGLGIYDLLNGPRFPGQILVATDPPKRTKMHWGGVIVGFEVEGTDRYRPRFTALIGRGDVSSYREKKKEDSDRSWYWVLVPTAWLGLGDSPDFLPQIGAGWRLVGGVDTEGTSSKMLTGATISAAGTFTSL